MTTMMKVYQPKKLGRRSPSFLVGLLVSLDYNINVFNAAKSCQVQVRTLTN